MTFLSRPEGRLIWRMDNSRAWRFAPVHFRHAEVRQNSNLDNGNIGGFRITHKRIILSYETATSLSGYAYCGGNVIAANATIIYQTSTPIDQVDRIYITIGAYGAPGRINVYAQGSGFISGHVLAVDAIIITDPI